MEEEYDDEIALDSTGNEMRLLTGTEVYFTLLKSFICSGFLYLPRAFVRCGWLYTSIMLVIVAFVTSYVSNIFLKAREKLKAGSMSELAYLCFGWTGKYVVDVFLVAT